jgi:hypothetical protein
VAAQPVAAQSFPLVPSWELPVATEEGVIDLVSPREGQAPGSSSSAGPGTAAGPLFWLCAAPQGVTVNGTVNTTGDLAALPAMGVNAVRLYVPDASMLQVFRN